MNLHRLHTLIVKERKQLFGELRAALSHVDQRVEHGVELDPPGFEVCIAARGVVPQQRS